MGLPINKEDNFFFHFVAKLLGQRRILIFLQLSKSLHLKLKLGKLLKLFPFKKFLLFS